MTVLRTASLGSVVLGAVTLLASCAAPPPPPLPPPPQAPEASRPVQTAMAPPRSPGKKVDQAYVAALIRIIKAQTVYDGPMPVDANPAVRYRVELLSDGEVIAVSLRESSGYPGFDEAVRHGILRASPLPRRADGVPELRLDIRFHMKQR